MKDHKVFIGDWIVDITLDDDGHLTVGVNHADKSKVICFNEDLSTNDSEWVDRFTSELIEKDYSNEF
jgi:hypothetical protein